MNKSFSLLVEQSGPQCLLVDLGNLKLQHLGIAQGGAADEHAFLWANRLLHNYANTCALEVSFGPSRFHFHHPAKIAITGAAQSFNVNDKRYAGWQSCEIKSGDTLHIDAPAAGVRSYLAVASGFVGEKLGAVITKDDMIFYQDDAEINRDFFAATTPMEFVPNYADVASLGVIVPQSFDGLPASLLDDFFQQLHTVTPASNRMAVLLEPNKPLQLAPENFYSQGLPLGAIQLPPSGKAIVLLKDRQSIGGYPVLGYLSHLDCFRLSQVRPGQSLRFHRQDIAQAQTALRDFYRFFLLDRKLATTG